MLIVVFLVIAVVIGIIVAVQIHEKKRTEGWAELAARMRFAFLGDARVNISEYPFKLFGRGRSKRTRNVLKGETHGFAMTVCDYQYTTQSGKNSSTHKQTICFVAAQKLDLPHVLLRREKAVLDWLGEVFGGQDVDFQDDPIFSGTYVLQGPENIVRRLFTRDARQFLVSHKDRFMTIETWQNEIMVNMGRRIAPEEFPRMSQFALEIMTKLGGEPREANTPVEQPRGISAPKLAKAPELADMPDLTPETPVEDKAASGDGVKIRLQP